MSCSFVKFSSSIGIFLNSANLICRSTDISKCFRGSLRLRDNESRLYFGAGQNGVIYYAIIFRIVKKRVGSINIRYIP